MKQWQPTWHGSPQQIRQATLSSPRRVFISEDRKCDPATAASYRAATIATSEARTPPTLQTKVSATVRLLEAIRHIRHIWLTRFSKKHFISLSDHT